VLGVGVLDIDVFDVTVLDAELSDTEASDVEALHAGNLHTVAPYGFPWLLESEADTGTALVITNHYLWFRHFSAPPPTSSYSSYPYARDANRFLLRTLCLARSICTVRFAIRRRECPTIHGIRVCDRRRKQLHHPGQGSRRFQQWNWHWCWK
jgi:hypothetical protein